MSTSLYDLTIPPAIRALNVLSSLLDKGRAYGAAQGIADDELLNARLAPDMFTLIGQVQRASDTCKGAVMRLAQTPPVPMPDEEASFDDLKARIARTIELLEAAPREAIDGREEASIILQAGPREIPFTGLSYVQGFVLPNLYFHVTAAYAILRMKGAPIGKLDYLVA